jgi:hypothetical protein
MSPIINQEILNSVPDELIRPLLALCMRTLQYNSRETYEDILEELNAIQTSNEIQEVQFLRGRLRSAVQLRICAMQDVQQWLRAKGQDAEPTEVYVNRWYVGMLVDGQRKGYLVSHEPDSIDQEAMEEKSRAVVLEATQDDSVFDS